MAIEEQDLKRKSGAAAEAAPARPEVPAPKAAKTPKPGASWLKVNRRLALIAVAAVIAITALIFVVPKLTGGGNSDLILAPVTRGDIEANVTALGNIQPKNYVDVGAQVSGQIKALHVNIGDQVKKGDLLLEIDAQVQQARVEADKDNLAGLQAQLVDQQAQLALKKSQYDRQVRLDREGATSKADLQSAKAAFDSASAQILASQAQIRQSQSSLEADQATLGYATIAAPMDGTVVSLAARLGQTLNSVQSAPILLRIADLSMMQIWTQVSEADVSKLKAGMPVYFSTLGNPVRRYDSKLEQILPTPETVNNVILFDALFDAPNPDGSLMTQMTAQVNFVTASAKDVLMVPAAAVRPLGARSGRQGTGGQGRRNGAGAGASAPKGQADAATAATTTTTTTTTTTESGSATGPATSDATATRGAGRRGAGGAGGRGAFAANHGTVEVMVNGKIEQRMIETGVSDRVNTEIKSGLKEGEQVVAGRKLPPAKGAAAQGGQQGRSPLQAAGGGPRGGGGGGRGFR